MENKDILLYVLIGLVLLCILNTYILQKKVSKIISKINPEKKDNKDILNQTASPSSTTVKTSEKFTSEDIVENYYNSNSFNKYGNKKVVTIDADGNMDMFEFPKGVIVAWAGASNQVPDGWTLCDGTGETPDLRGKFILGAADNSKYQVGALGGAEQHTLKPEEMPKHSHDVYTGSGPGCTNYDSLDVYTNCSGKETRKNMLIEAGGNQPHNNMPPYFALCYIMKNN